MYTGNMLSLENFGMTKAAPTNITIHGHEFILLGQYNYLYPYSLYPLYIMKCMFWLILVGRYVDIR